MSSAVFAVMRFHFVVISRRFSKMASLPPNRYVGEQVDH